MLKYSFYLLLFSIEFKILAQENLVPNSGFENYTPRASSKAFLDQVDDWFSPGEGKNYAPYPTPDHFIETDLMHKPGTIKYYTIYADSAIAGIITYMNRRQNYREYLAVKLIKPMVINSLYEVSMYVLTPLSSLFGNIISNGLGVRFSMDSPRQNKGNYLQLKPHFQLAKPLEARRWEKITSRIVVDSAYRFLTIGNFLPDFKTQTIYSQYESDPQCYFFIDQVSIQEIKLSLDTTKVLKSIVHAASPKTSSPHKAAKGLTNLPISIEGRFVYQQNHLKTKHRKIVVKVWDRREVDGDVISLKFNDDWILKSFPLTKLKKRLTLTLDTGRQNFIIVFAENLGRKPPNTASFILKTRERKKVFSIRSDFKSCGAIKLDYEDP